MLDTPTAKAVGFSSAKTFAVPFGFELASS
ncbi:hypothetical protein JNUCC1_01293 [Lentibacillus sp. JNUCC-1]|nr:hypothetical protein [Lentibacillus sp. JNUCC-1]